MWMAGFQTASPSDGCVAFLFQPWVLSTTAKFAIACLGTLAMGLAVEGLVALRRALLARWKPRSWVAKSAGMLGLYGLQVMLGYLLMLVSMTYQVELFVCVILGLMAGHGVFNLRAPVTESADACCLGHDASLDDKMRGSTIATDTSGSVVSTFETRTGCTDTDIVEHLPNCCAQKEPC